MTNSTPDEMEDDAEMKKRLMGAYDTSDEPKEGEDPFATDALGHTPAEEDDSGSL